MFGSDFAFLCALCGIFLAYFAFQGFSLVEDQKILIAKPAKKSRKGRKDIQIPLLPLTMVPLLNS
jgi:hypothetical protein